MFKKAAKSIVGLSTFGAITSLVLLPAVNSKTRKRVTRSARNVYFKVTDLFEDMKDMKRR